MFDGYTLGSIYFFLCLVRMIERVRVDSWLDGIFTPLVTYIHESHVSALDSTCHPLFFLILVFLRLFQTQMVIYRYFSNCAILLLFLKNKGTVYFWV